MSSAALMMEGSAKGGGAPASAAGRSLVMSRPILLAFSAWRSTGSLSRSCKMARENLGIA